MNIFTKTIKQHFIEKWLKKHRVIDYVINDDLTIDVNNTVNLANHGLKKIPVQFNVVKGDFNVSHNKLKTLQGSPKEVYGHFICEYNELTNLEGVTPKLHVLQCRENKLTTLEGIGDVSEKLDCSHNELTHLNFIPKNIESLSCYNNRLESFPLENLIVDKSINIQNNPLLVIQFLIDNGNHTYSMDYLKLKKAFCHENVQQVLLPFEFKDYLEPLVIERSIKQKNNSYLILNIREISSFYEKQLFDSSITIHDGKTAKRKQKI
jgi:hypothetical protein